MPTDRSDEISRLVRAMLGTALIVGGFFVRFYGAHGSDRHFAALALAVVGMTLLLAVWGEVFSSSPGRDGGRTDPAHESKARTRLGRFIERYW